MSSGPAVRVRRPDGPVRSLRGVLRSAFVENAAIKFVAFVLALTVFFLVHSDSDAVLNLQVGVFYSVPDGKVLASRPPDSVVLTIRGSRRLIKRLDEREIERIHLDLPDRSGEFVFQNDMVSLPAGVKLVSIRPPSFGLRLDTPMEREVPVKPVTTGAPEKGFEVVAVRVSPQRVTLRGGRRAIETVTSIATRPLSLDGKTESFTANIVLDPPQYQGEVVGDSQVRVEVEISERLASREFPPAQVVLEAAAGISPEMLARFSAEPKQVRVVMRGPALLIGKPMDDRLRPTVTVIASDLIPGVTRKAPVVLRGLPQGIAVELHPPEIALSLK